MEKGRCDISPLFVSDVTRLSIKRNVVKHDAQC